MKTTTAALLSISVSIVAALVVAGPDWHRPVPATQTGPDGSGMAQFADTSPWRVAAAPTVAEPAGSDDGGGLATASYKNIQVLTDVSAAEFMRLQRAMTAWVSPTQGCAFCHTGDNFAADDNPMKTVTRDMLRLTRTLNTTWRGHMGESGVTCFSCHRAEPVPPETWFPSRPKSSNAFDAQSENWDETADTVRKFFPDNGWALYFLHDEPITAESTTALPNGSVAPQIGVTRIYEMMMQMSDGIGVNCGYCHNSRSFQDWSQSTPARWTAYDAIRMMRDVNSNYLVHLRDTLPQIRDLVKQSNLVLPPGARDPQPGAGLAVCATCHYGHIKPDAGLATISNYPSLASSVNAQPTTPASLTPPIDEAK